MSIGEYSISEYKEKKGNFIQTLPCIKKEDRNPFFYKADHKKKVINISTVSLHCPRIFFFFFFFFFANHSINYGHDSLSKEVISSLRGESWHIYAVQF